MSINRSERIYQRDDGLWYFNVRGKQAKGPFDSHHHAETELDNHIRGCRRHIGRPLWPGQWQSLRLKRRGNAEPHHT